MTEITTDNTKAPINALERIEVLEAENAKLKEAARDCAIGHTFPCAIQRSGRRKPKCICGHDALAALVEGNNVPD